MTSLPSQRTAAENYAHHHGHPLYVDKCVGGEVSQRIYREKEFTKEQIKNAFFVNGTKWKRNVVRRGILTMFQVRVVCLMWSRAA